MLKKMAPKLFEKLQPIIGGNQISARESRVRYEAARNILERQNQTEKQILARMEKAQPEILYYLASDESPAVRREVAKNPGTPVQANRILVEDHDDQARYELARKIARLLPDLDLESKAKVYEETLEILEILAQDQLPRVRAIIAEELKYEHNVPKRIILKLAHDLDTTVSAPILEYSPLLSDLDLKEIISTSTAKLALSAIARRKNIGTAVTDALVSSLDIPAISHLLANPDAKIRDETMDLIVGQAEKVVDLHEPLCSRPNLSMRVMRRVAGFVASSLVEKMVQAGNLRPAQATDLLRRTRDRINKDPTASPDSDEIAKNIASMHDKGLLNDQFIMQAILNNQRQAVIYTLATLTGLSTNNVMKILSRRDGRTISALCWKAGLAMRTSFNIQVEFAKVSKGNLLYPRNGTDYPLSSSKMRHLLERL